jgi:hypothetical protein
MLVIDKPRFVAPPDSTPPERLKKPNTYQIVFYPGTNGVCAGSINILQEIFRYSQRGAIYKLINSTLTLQETIYTGPYDVAQTKLAEAQKAKAENVENFPRLKRVRFTCEVV